MSVSVLLLTYFSAYDAYISHDLLSTLSKAPNLQSLAIEFSAEMIIWLGDDFFPYTRGGNPFKQNAWEERGPSFGHPHQYLGLFRNLKRLTLLELWGNLAPWQE